VTTADETRSTDAQPRLGVWHLVLPAAPHPLLLRRDRPFDPAAPSTAVADVLRYVSVARRVLKGPLALEIEGPGDPLASPETVLRSLALLREHHPDVLVGLVIDGPLLPDYAEEVEAFEVGYLVVRRDAATARTARRLVEGAVFRGDTLARDAAADLWLEEASRATRLAARMGIPVATRLTLVPTVNAGEVAAVARAARADGARRMDVVPHRPAPGSPLARSGVPTAPEIEGARAEARMAFGTAEAEEGALGWLAPDRLQAVNLDVLDALDVLRALPAPPPAVPAAPVLPPRRAQLVAVATSDGTLVDTPLAAASLLRVYAVTEDGTRFLGARPLPLDPRRRLDGVGDAQAFLHAVVGCRAVLATTIPPRAATLLGAVGIRAVARGGPVEEVLDRIARGTLRHAEAGGA